LLRDAAGIPPDTQVVLYHGALTANRGIEALIDAALDDRLGGVALVLMGFGERRDYYARLAGSERGRERVHILDPVPPAALLPWVASADIGAMPNPGATLNDRYSSPNKLFECIAAGTPVVASDFPTMRRIVIENPDGPLGAVCEPGRVESIIDAIRSIASLDPAAREDLRARCLRAAAERWNWDHEQGALLAVYAAILTRPGEQPVVKPAA
jgi:glycosyltransferase involved in cell wall biosynthesis